MGTAETRRAIEAADKALPAWRALTAKERSAKLRRWFELMIENQDDLARLMTTEQGKPLAEAKGEIAYAASFIEWFAEEAKRVYGDTIPGHQPDKRLIVIKQPIGVTAAITPWNFPAAMITRKAGPALAAGCTMVLKPASQTPYSALALVELAHRAGIPAGVLNVLPGYGHTVGKALALHMDVDTLVFTGSTKIAKQLMVYAGESNMKRIWLEAGGKSPNIVFADAPDLQAAAEAAASAIAFNQGEVCTAGSRLLVERSIKDKFLPMVVEALKGWKPGNPLDPQTTVGALVDTQQMNTVLSYIEAGHKDGAKLLAGGKRTLEETGGTYVEPTIFDGVTNAMRIAQEEIFGPVLSVIAFDTAEEAIAIANDTPYGLAAGIWTSDISKAHKTARAVRAGSVWVNQYDGGDMTAPFGGFKQSGNGRDKSLHALEKYTELKATWIKL